MRDDLAKLLMLGLFAGSASSNKPRRTWKQKFSNLLGLAMLSFFVILVMTMGALRWAALGSTRDHLDILAQKVAHLDRPALMNWASGNEKDHWDNTFVLERNSEDVQFRSKGPDGVLDTKDDILGKVCIKQRPKYDLTPVISADQVKPEKSLLSKAYDKYKSWKGNHETE